MSRRGWWLLAGAAWLLAPAAASEALPLPEAQKAGARQILDHASGRLAAFDYAHLADTLVLDFPTLEEQGLIFNRIAAFVEKRGAPRDRVLDDGELAAFIRAAGKTPATLAFGNDFRAAQLAVFFNHAEHGRVALNGHELALLDALQRRGWLARRNGFYQALRPGAVVLSLPQRRPGAPGQPGVSGLARRTILLHELSHAEFFVNAEYAEYARRFWSSVLSEAQREAFRAFLARGGYDAHEGDILINEVQAYLMHTPDPAAFGPSLLKLPEREIGELRRRFLAGKPPTRLFEATAELR